MDVFGSSYYNVLHHNYQIITKNYMTIKLLHNKLFYSKVPLNIGKNSRSQ